MSGARQGMGVLMGGQKAWDEGAPAMPRREGPTRIEQQGHRVSGKWRAAVRFKVFSGGRIDNIG